MNIECTHAYILGYYVLHSWEISVHVLHSWEISVHVLHSWEISVHVLHSWEISVHVLHSWEISVHVLHSWEAGVHVCVRATLACVAGKQQLREASTATSTDSTAECCGPILFTFNQVEHRHQPPSLPKHHLHYHYHMPHKNSNWQSVYTKGAKSCSVHTQCITVHAGKIMCSKQRNVQCTVWLACWARSTHPSNLCLVPLSEVLQSACRDHRGTREQIAQQKTT